MGDDMVDFAGVAAEKKRPWYKWRRFPLVPVLERREGDRYNPNSWYFSWLCFNFWSLDHVSFEFEAGVKTSFDPCIFAGAVLPYLRVYISIPLPRIIDSYRLGLHRGPAFPEGQDAP